MRLWLDLDNPSDVNQFAPLVSELRDHECYVTTRRFSGLEQLLDERGLAHHVVGGYPGSSIVAKAIWTAFRTFRLAATLPKYDASVTDLGVSSVLAARFRGLPAIGFLDNDLPTTNLRVSAPFVSRIFVPQVFDERILQQFGLEPRAVRYNGFKEDMAASNYSPDPTFVGRLPFRDYVLVRAESSKAEYVPRSEPTIVPALLDSLEQEHAKVVFLPRYPEDREYARGHANVYMPPGSLNGMDACFHARAVLTGSGTLAREAAVLGVPGASFFPGRTLLSVDREMVRRGWILHSRNPEELARFAMTAQRWTFDQARCKSVMQTIIHKLDRALADLADGS